MGKGDKVRVVGGQSADQGPAPLIVILHSVEDEGDVRCLTLEPVEVRRVAGAGAPGGLPIPGLVEVGIAPADSRVAAREKGVVHRALVPADVTLTRDARDMVLDCGPTKRAAPDSDRALTQAEAIAAPLSREGQVMEAVRSPGADCSFRAWSNRGRSSAILAIEPIGRRHV